jgi:HEPN domain-containing protein
MQANKHRQILHLIEQHEAPEAIFIIAQATIQYNYTNVFFNVPETMEQPNAYLLLIIIDADTRQCTQIQGKLENILQPVTAVTCWCMPLSTFNEMLLQGQYFACTVISQAERLFTAQDAELVTPSIIPYINQYQPAWYQRALEFYAGAELYIIRKQYAMAAFHLHQCAEQALTSIVYNKSGYRPATHNLLLLFRYACWFEPLLHGLFPPQPVKADSLLHLLQQAYSRSRYTNDFSVKGKQLEMIKEKMEQLLSLAKITGKGAKAQNDTVCNATQP